MNFFNFCKKCIMMEKVKIIFFEGLCIAITILLRKTEKSRYSWGIAKREKSR